MAFLRRYTNLAATIHMLKTKRITLLNPATWDDRNDAYFISEYKRLKKAKNLLALCFAESKETYHHWKVFSYGSDGICLEFDKDSLLHTFSGDPRIKHGSMEYRIIKELGADEKVSVEELPFLKRAPYQDEREYRVICVDMEQENEVESYDFDIGWIRRVTLSPWMSKALANSVKETLRSIPGCTNLPVSRSTLVENEKWKKLALTAV